MTSSPSAGDRPDGGDVVFTLGRGYRAPLLRRGAVAVTLGGIAAVLAGSGFVPLITWVAAVVFGAGALLEAVLYVWQGRFRTRLTARGIEARGYFDHFIPWSEVTGIEAGGTAIPDAEPAPLAGRPWDSPARQPLSRLTHPYEGGYRGQLASVRVIRRRDRGVLLRAPLVTSWQDDPRFEDKVQILGQWRRDYGQVDAQ